jgi:hypothetical protein
MIRLIVGSIAFIGLWAMTNWAYHAFKKPTELLFPVSSMLAKSPEETWREYGPDFRRHATAAIGAELLAALAQVESAGNPLAQTYWKWRPSWHPFEVYRPASSAVGMYQITNATYADTRRECRSMAGVPGDRSDSRDSCWFESLYARVAPSQAVALTASLLDRRVATTLKRRRIANATLHQKQHLAAVIHLCGARTGDAYARRDFRLTRGERCGDHDVRAYLERIHAMEQVFARLARRT